MSLTAGAYRTVITPPWGVELAGWGYYLRRTWERVRDDLNATALVLTDEDGRSMALLALDLMYNDPSFTRSIRDMIAAQTDLQPEAICINCSHSHNAPTAGFILGAGEQDPEYLRFAARQAATAAIVAWRNRQPASLYTGRGNLAEVTYNRTREHGPVDTSVSVLRVDSSDGHPLAVAVNFHAHPCAHTAEDSRAVSRDVPGEVVDQIETALPGAVAMYLQGTAGDVNFYRDGSTAALRAAPGRALTGVALKGLGLARPVKRPNIRVVSYLVKLPTRRWTREELARDREEGLYRLKSGDTTNWLNGFAKALVNDPPNLPKRYGGSVERTVAALSRFASEWTDKISPELDTRPEDLETEIQAFRVGDVYFAAHGAELFSTLGLELRRRWPHEDLFVLGYSNTSIGYMPDAHDVARQTYAANTSPKCTGQFPFTAEAGGVLVEHLWQALRETSD